MRLTWHLTVRQVIAMIAFGLFIIALGYYLGNLASEKSRARIELIFPYFAQMEKSDRVIIVRSAMECNLSGMPVQREAVMECLRQGAKVTDSRHPELGAVARIEILLKK
jgi:hypothetical protein